MQETYDTWVRSLGWEDPLEVGLATHSSILGRRIPLTGAWQAAAHGVTKSWTRLKWLSTRTPRRTVWEGKPETEREERVYMSVTHTCGTDWFLEHTQNASQAVRLEEVRMGQLVTGALTQRLGALTSSRTVPWKLLVCKAFRGGAYPGTDDRNSSGA